MVNMSLSELTLETIASPSGRVEEAELCRVTVGKAPKVDGESLTSMRISGAGVNAAPGVLDG